MKPDAQEFAHRFPALARELGSTGCETLLSALTPRSLAAREVLIAEGTASSTIYLLREGSLAVTLASGGADLEVGRLDAGVIVGETSFVDGGPASATVAAIGDCRLLALPMSALEELRRQHPRVATGLLRALCHTLTGRLRSATDRLETLRGEAPAAGAAHTGGFVDALRALFGLARG
ncbi:MAG: cyclic nucleotide-binding domain-containing protein [Myxococcales bacterium]|nr:cyclic nucleotide-binding domain-containing protein [Myxococcales bacterium]